MSFLPPILPELRAANCYRPAYQAPSDITSTAHDEDATSEKISVAVAPLLASKVVTDTATALGGAPLTSYTSLFTPTPLLPHSSSSSSSKSLREQGVIIPPWANMQIFSKVAGSITDYSSIITDYLSLKEFLNFAGVNQATRYSKIFFLNMQLRGKSELTNGQLYYYRQAMSNNKKPFVSWDIVFKSCTQLTTLKRSLQPRREFSQRRNDFVRALRENCTNLTHLSLVSDLFCPIEVIKLIQASTHLTTIDIRYMSGIEDQFVKEVVQARPDLKNIYISQCKNLTKNAVEFLTGCPNLESVDLSFYDDLEDESIIKLATTCKKLIILNGSRCKRLTDTSLQVLAQCCQLRSVDFWGCENFSDKGVKQLASTRCLTHANFQACSALTDNSLEGLAQNPGLTSVNLQGCTKVSDQGLQRLALCLRLTRLNLNDCEKIGDSGLSAFSQHCLTHLSMSNCHRLTTETLKWFARASHNLIAIDFSGCPNVTDAVVIEFLNHCPHLNRLNFDNCIRISPRLREKLKTYSRPPPF